MHEVALREGNDTSISNFSCDTVFSHFRIEKKTKGLTVHYTSIG